MHNPAYPDTERTIAIDFDGVIHDDDKGYYDGTCYGLPVRGATNALRKLSELFKIVIYTTKVREDRPLINGKTGYELIWAWLAKHELDKYVAEVTAEKPTARWYIDDRAIVFKDWDDTLKEMAFGLWGKWKTS